MVDPYRRPGACELLPECTDSVRYGVDGVSDANTRQQAASFRELDATNYRRNGDPATRFGNDRGRPSGSGHWVNGVPLRECRHYSPNPVNRNPPKEHAGQIPERYCTLVHPARAAEEGLLSPRAG
ncbi:MAG: hypothetical protein JO212_09085 [Acetobacteraceae bacterium]|nr:hypothetical protein [Acetobacteraceae bacterium]